MSKMHVKQKTHCYYICINLLKGENMIYKRLRASKTIESKKAEKLSCAVKGRVESSVRNQCVNLMKLSDSEAEIAAEIRDAGYYMLRTCRDMNEYFSAVSGNYKISPEKEELCEFITKFCEAVKPFAERRGFGILHNLSCKEVFVNVDTDKFYYALANIVLNAMENSMEGTRIKISLSVTKKFAKIMVSDKGTGMNEETAKHCCEPFFSTKKEKNENRMGLGLTLARHFVQESGGRFHIKSKPGKGTSVSVMLPLIEEGQGLAVKSSSEDIFKRGFEILEMVFAKNPEER